MLLPALAGLLAMWQGLWARRNKAEDVPLLTLAIGKIHPAPENDTLYRPIDPADPEIVACPPRVRPADTRAIHHTDRLMEKNAGDGADGRDSVGSMWELRG